MKYGYVRVSSQDQNEARQVEALQKHNLDKVFIEKISGKNTNRPQFQAMMSEVKEGDTIFIHDFSRLARSTTDLLKIVEELQSINVHLVSNKENIDTATPTGKLMLTMIGAINEFERTNLLERQREGVAIAKAAGKYKGRQPNHDEKLLKKLTKDFVNKEISVKDFMKLTGYTRSNIYYIINKYKDVI